MRLKREAGASQVRRASRPWKEFWLGSWLSRKAPKVLSKAKTRLASERLAVAAVW